MRSGLDQNPARLALFVDAKHQDCGSFAAGTGGVNLFQRHHSGFPLGHNPIVMALHDKGDAALQDEGEFFPRMPVFRQGNIWRQGNMAENHFHAGRALEHVGHQVLDDRLFQTGRTIGLMSHRSGRQANGESGESGEGGAGAAGGRRGEDGEKTGAAGYFERLHGISLTLQIEVSVMRASRAVRGNRSFRHTCGNHLVMDALPHVRQTRQFQEIPSVQPEFREILRQLILYLLRLRLVAILAIGRGGPGQ